MNKREVFFMKKSQTAIILFVALLSGCGVAAN
nr:lipoprotein [Enterococcus casseliflavus]